MDSYVESISIPGRSTRQDWPCLPNFPAAMDRPAGRVEGTVSGINGQPLRYFVPDTLPELLQRCSGFKHERECGKNDVPMALTLARAAARRRIAGKVDEVQARRFCDLIIGARAYASADAMKRLGIEISSRNHGLREEIVYAGGTIPSAAKIIFAPHGYVPALFDSLSEGLDAITFDDDAGLTAAVTGFFCVSMHPFLDGNGRWSRLIAVEAGMRAGFIASAMSSAVFQNAAKQELADDVWPRTRHSGLREYLELSLRFEKSLLAQLAERGIARASDAIWSQLKQSVRGRLALQEAALGLFAGQRLAIGRLRELCGASERAMNGMIERLLHESGGLLELEATHLTMRPLHESMEKAIQAATGIVFNRSK